MGDFVKPVSPGKIGSLTLRNGIIMSSMDVNTCSPEGIMPDEAIPYFAVGRSV